MEALRKVRDEDPSTYVRVVASLMPKQVELEHKPEDELDDEQLAAVYAEVLTEIERRAAKGGTDDAP